MGRAVTSGSMLTVHAHVLRRFRTGCTCYPACEQIAASAVATSSALHGFWPDWSHPDSQRSATHMSVTHKATQIHLQGVKRMRSVRCLICCLVASTGARYARAISPISGHSP